MAKIALLRYSTEGSGVYEVLRRNAASVSRAARNRNTAKCGVKRLRGARGAPPTSEGKSTYFIAGAIIPLNFPMPASAADTSNSASLLQGLLRSLDCCV